MTKIYASAYIEIYSSNNILIQNWTTKPLNTSVFKNELKHFLDLFFKYKPKGLLWIQDNFDLEIPEEMYNWIEEHILVPQYKAGLRKLAFTVPKEQFAYLSIINSFNEVKSVLQPRYFICTEKALAFLHEKNLEENITETSLKIDHLNDKSKVSFDVEHRHLPQTIKYLKKLNKHLNFRVHNKQFFDLLTIREIEIIKLIGEGKDKTEIAKALFISKNTVITHRRNIIKKLNIKSQSDWKKYIDVFF
ncbi:response regulator transcription factor [Aurantibacter aestuarii]|uniref:HTH luxR-type domain-containing protein n=1 Tax=Aurantibacter aestuarii TaxID=1266046 RepID=A0A2T1ND28_9FLAO|nr:helix-turn-helix transcriptional regulator [Aurantibacter aestuarii]PSG90326.1 hypothetical protein C7H52_03330 [Aurantibacter aestuarii]